MWESVAADELPFTDYNEELLKIKGYIDSDTEAKYTYAKFLRHNLSIAAHLIGGVDLYPMQHIAINAMFKKDFFLGIWGRGNAKSYTAAIFCFLYALFNPGIKIGIISKSFRQSRAIFKQIEDFAGSPEGILLMQCIGARDHKNDSWEMTLGESKIVALPLGDGKKLRGWRFNCVVIDELLLMPEEIIEGIIKPFLAVRYKAREREKVKIQEDDLIARGLMDEKDRRLFLENKLIGLSSASYQVETLYKTYLSYEQAIRGDKNKGEEPQTNFGIMQLSWEAAPVGLLDIKKIKEAMNTMSEAQFLREYGARFTDDSSGYFSMKKMILCDLGPDENPTIELKGDKEAKYIISIDPNFDDSETSDHFAITVLKLCPDGRRVVVHQYAVAKSGLKERIDYMLYLLTHFNIVYIILDHAGAQQFLDALNNSEAFKQAKINLGTFTAEFDKDDQVEAMKQAKLTYNLAERRICHVQFFSPQWIRRANEMLQSAFDHKRIWFGARGAGHLESLMSVDIPIDKLVFDPENDAKERDVRMIDFIEHQDTLIKLVKDECALIVISTTSTGHQSFDLPQNLRRQRSSPDRARKDSYSALLLVNWASKCYDDMINDRTEAPKNTFIPRLIR